jgi:DNA processing protein
VAHAYGVAIAAAGWILVSGLARGIDAAAHSGTVAAGGRGVGVLGCGIDVPYPRTTHHLRAGLLAHGGALATEYPPGTHPDSWRFPPRNRIIAGMAIAVVVIEAAERGGALITAHRAAESGVPVFAVPGDIDRETSRGCNLLIRDGAHPVLEPADLIEELTLVEAAAGREHSPALR